MAYVLAVSALKLRSPMRLIIPVEAYDFALHCLSLLQPDVTRARVAARYGTPPEHNRKRDEPADESCCDERQEHSVVCAKRSFNRCRKNPELRDVYHHEQDKPRLLNRRAATPCTMTNGMLFSLFR